MGSPLPGHAPLSATRDELNDKIARMYNSINSFQATVDMIPSKGSVYKGQITEYKDVRAFILFRKPADIRIQAQPVMRTQLFDMVSNGTEFRFFNDSNLFMEGLTPLRPPLRTQWKISAPALFSPPC